MQKSLNEIRKEVAGKAPSSSASGEKTYLPVFVPMGRQAGNELMNCSGKRVPVHMIDIKTRGDMMNDNLDASMRSGNFAAVYKAYVLAVFFAMATIITAFFNVWIAAVCAYLAGHFYSERLLNAAWGIGWYKGKSMTYTL